MKLKDILPQEIPKNQEVIWNRNCILIAIITFYVIYYTKNQYFNILQIMVGYFTYTNNIIKHMVKNFYYIDF